jgi:G3E family GTPase
LLEASGVAEPLSIAQTFNNPSLRKRLAADSVMCVVDAEQVFFWGSNAAEAISNGLCRFDYFEQG